MALPESDYMTQLRNKLKDRTARIAVIGLGYVGLPLSVAFAEAGLTVIGYDVQHGKTEALSRGESYIMDVKSERLAPLIKSGVLEAVNDIGKCREADAVCICVPTPLTKTKEPDLSYVVSAAEALYPHLKQGQLIVLESTTYPGTTREVLLPILERSGLKAGTDFYLAYSPERVDPANKNYSIKNTPKHVGGIDDQSTEFAELLYRQVADTVISLSSPDVAEMAKIFENVYRSVNISLVNELARLCEAMSISVWEVIEAASTKPYGYATFYPGPGIGGHCIPLDPHYLASKAREFNFQSRFIELAADVNEQMPHYVVDRVAAMLKNSGKSLKDAAVLVLGIAYKKDIADTRESPALDVIRLLHNEGTRITYNDPFVGTTLELDGVANHVELTLEALSSVDCVVITTAHSSYDYQFIVANSSLVFDTRGVTRQIDSDNIVRLGE